MLSLNKKMLFLGLLLSLFQGAFAAAGKIGLPCQKQTTENQVQSTENQVSKPVSFVEAVQNDQPTGLPEEKEKYADKVLKDDISFFGSVGRILAKLMMIGAFIKVTGNETVALAAMQLSNEALIKSGYFKDVRVMHFHKDATWWQFFKSLDGVMSSQIDESDYVSKTRKIVCRVLIILVALTTKNGDQFNPNNHNYNFKRGAFNAINIALVEISRQQMINSPEDSPCTANVAAILLAGSMNEVIKKVA